MIINLFQSNTTKSTLFVSTQDGSSRSGILHIIIHIIIAVFGHHIAITLLYKLEVFLKT